MASVTVRRTKNGVNKYTFQIRITKNGKQVYTESKTFTSKEIGSNWAKQRELELETPGAIEETKKEDPTLASVIDRYIDESKQPIKKTKKQVLTTIKKSYIGEKLCSEIDSQTLVQYAQSFEVQPQTVNNYLSHLASVISIAKPAWNYPLSMQAMDDARKVAKKLGLTTRSRSRARRPTLDELDRLLNHFTTYEMKNAHKKLWFPMRDLILFAIFSTRRQAEIFRITWEDLHEANSTILVRDMKNPGATIANDVQAELPNRALQIILKRKTKSSAGIIFPYDGKSVGDNFRDACKILGIKNLRFHDLRHEGISCLFEMGRTIPQAASVSGHLSWQSLQRYTHLKQIGDKYAGWKWLETLNTETPAFTAKIVQNLNE